MECALIDPGNGLAPILGAKSLPEPVLTDLSTGLSETYFSYG